MAKPIVDGIEQDLDGKAQVIRLDVTDQVGGLAAHRYGVRSIPTLIVFDGQGELVATFVGVPNRKEVNQAVETLISIGKDL